MFFYLKLAYKYFASLAVVILILTLMSCTSEYSAKILNDSLKSAQLSDQHEIYRENTWIVDTHYSIYLGKTEFVGLDENLMPRAANLLNNQIQFQFGKYFSSLYIEEKPQVLQKTLKSARLAESQLLIKTRFLDYSDNLNRKHEILAGSNIYEGKHIETDKTLLQFKIYDVNSSRLLDTTTISSKQRYFAQDDSHTTDLFKDALSLYLLTITGTYSKRI